MPCAAPPINAGAGKAASPATPQGSAHIQARAAPPAPATRSPRGGRSAPIIQNPDFVPRQGRECVIARLRRAIIQKRVGVLYNRGPEGAGADLADVPGTAR